MAAWWVCVWYVWCMWGIVWGGGVVHGVSVCHVCIHEYVCACM